MQKDDIQTGLLAYPILSGATNKETITQQPTNSIFHSISLLELGQYRVKNHCHYDSQSVSTTDYSIFQIEILDNELQRFYQGRFILEIWNKYGERIFQKVVQEELTQWKLYNNVFIFKAAAESPLIYVVWLHEKKMAAIKHPYDDHKEVDMIYYDGYLIVAQAHNFRFAQLASTDVNTNIFQFMNPDESMSPLIERDFSGIIQNDRIVAMIPNPVRHELIFLCASESYQIIYYKYQVNKQTEKRQVTLQKIEQDPKKKSKLDKKQAKLLESLQDIQQILLINKSGTPYLLVLRKNQTLEIIESFSQTIYAEQRLNLTKMLPSFGEKITFQFSDGSIAQAASLDKITERQFLTESEYYKQQAQPPQTSIQYEIHRLIHFYQDAIIINQSLFISRDNVIFIVDTFTKQVAQKFPQKQKIVSLHKLKQQSDDDKGYKVTTYKVVAVHKNGSLQVFVPGDINLMNDWQKSDISNTPMINQKDPVQIAFQNQNAFNNLYIVTSNSQNNTQKLFQMMFNTQIIELSNLKLYKGDQIFSVNSVSRQREMISVVDAKYLTVYRNDKGNLIKLYQLNHTRYDLRENISPNSVFYFQKEYVLIMTKKLAYKINIATSAVDTSKLTDAVRAGGSVFIDAQCFYFLTDGEEEGSSKLAVVDTGMIEASFIDKSKDEAQNAIIDKNKGMNSIMYPTWIFKNPIRRLDYDEYNSVLNLQLSNHEIIQVPLFHRNTMHFIGMAERTFYLCFKKQGDLLYALDKQNFVNCWSMNNGQLLSRTYVQTNDYRLFEVDRDVYDKNWFKFTLVYKNDQNLQSPSEAEQQAVIYRQYKIVDIDDKGNVFEWLNFVHPFQKNMECHLYFNSEFNQMIEVLLNKNKNSKATYNHYILENALSQKWKFMKTLNQGDNQVIEWHQKTLYPYNLNEKTFEQETQEALKDYDTYKLIGQDEIKILNTQDGIEMLFDSKTGHLETFMALQYSFTNTKDSFYDKKCGHFYVQEVTSRLQNFYEAIRRQIFLKNKTNIKLRTLDVSARDFKYKYLIEQSFTQFDNQFFNQFFVGKEDKLIKIFKQMSNDHIQRLVHNVFPEGGNTLMHFIAQSSLGFESVDFIAQLSKKEGFVVPFLINLEQLTPLDIMVAKKDFKQTNSMMKLLQKTPMDHHSRLISHLIPKLIEISLPQLDKYFDKRKFQTGVCKTINLGRLRVAEDKDFKSVPTTLINDNSDNVKQSLMHQKSKELSLKLEVLDIPLHQYKVQDIKEKQVIGSDINDYEIKLIKSLATTENLELFQQKSVRAYVDFLWPHARNLIVKNLFIPYMAFIIYYMFYLMVLKKLYMIQSIDPQFYQFTSGMFAVYDILFKFVLFLGCFYFLYQDFLQIKNLPNNSIVLWTYASVVPLALMIFIIIYDTFVDSDSQDLNKSFYSASAFFVWIRVIHLMKLFSHTSYLLRMASQVVFRIRWLICFIIISLLAFGFTFFQLSDTTGSLAENPSDGITYMFYVLIGRYDVESFSNVYLSILLVVVSCFNFFFIFTLLVALSVVAFSKDSDVNSNEAYSDKSSIIALYSYLLTQTAVREPAKKYLLIATVTEGRKKGSSSDSSGLHGGADMKTLQAKMIKNIDRRMNALTGKVEKTLKDIQDRLENVQQRND